MDLLAALYAKLGGVYGIPWDAGAALRVVLHTIHKGVCLIGPQACAGGFVVPFLWNRHVRVGQINFWNYARPSGIRIFNAIAAEFARRGATHLECSSHFPANRAGDFYRHAGLRPVETVWTMRLPDITLAP